MKIGEKKIKTQTVLQIRRERDTGKEIREKI